MFNFSKILFMQYIQILKCCLDKIWALLKLNSFQYNLNEHAVLILANTLYGPMHTKSGVAEYIEAVKEIKKHGGKIAYGGKVSNFFSAIFRLNLLYF